MIQDIVLYVSLALMALVGLSFVLVLRRAPQAGDAAAVQAGAGRVRSRLFWALCVVGVGYAVATLVPMPIPAQAAAGGAAQTVEITGAQWSWELSAREVYANEPVEFRVTSRDVNHGLGVYDENLTLLTQTQAMPGYVNRLVYTFERPGTYKLLCLEYCGLAHHGMAAELTVLPAPKS